MRDMSKLRFDALAAYCRSPGITVLAEEMWWLEFVAELLRGVLLLDADDEFSVVLLARDLDERYRWSATTGYFASPDDAFEAAGERRRRCCRRTWKSLNVLAVQDSRQPIRVALWTQSNALCS